ncbi:GA module protein [Gardnerella vaginalis 315-A]|uniref:GA module-containing protein n=1 Tax=Gardnerella vaginalis TaxID=2702 RepID=UPI00020D6E42|nr:GA module-containing protein [Gardnerella vaginalis]EGL13251.1 GA module protein [Gardnerella vaginalis 315-A]
MSKKIRVVKHYSGVNSGVGADSQPVLSKSVCAAMLAGAMVLGGGVFVSSPAYADGYVDGTGNNIYYGYKTDASYTEARFHIEVDYYDTLEHAQAGKDEGKDPLGKFVRVHYLSNCAKKDGAADDWRFRPMWWYGVPKGLKNVQNITYTRVEKLTNQRGNQPFVPTGSSQFTFTDTNGYGVVSKKTYPTPKQWKSISNFYFDEQNVLASKGWKQLLGLNGGSYDNAGNTESQWGVYQEQTAGLQGIFVDWESAGQRFYDMTYVGEMTKEAWENRDVNPLRFAAGVYRFAGNWHYAVGQKHNTPKIADHLKLNYPEVTKVKKLDALSNDEKGKVKEAIEKANRGKAGSQTLFDELVKDGQDGIVINNDGSATITFKDNTKRIMPASLLVTKDETDSDKYKPTLPDATPVVNPSVLTKEDKEAVIAAFKKANPDSSEFSKHLAKDNAIAFDKDGKNLVVTYEDGSKATIPASELVFQGPKISDWAPYVVPDVIEVENLSKLTDTEKKQVTDAFDKANADLDVYIAAKKDDKTPVSFDKDFKNAIITWADGSTTEIPSWQFLKQKAAEQTPTPKPPTPKPAEEKKTFTVDLPDAPAQVKFDPFDKHATVAPGLITTLQNQLKGRNAKDANDPSKSVTITSATISIADGTVTFKADGYEDKVYPIGIFYKKEVTGTGTQNPTQQTPTSKTDTDPNNNKNTYKYFVTKTQINESKVSDVKPQEAAKALKQFVKDNYTGWTEQELASVTSNVAVGKNWTAKAGTTNLEPYNNGNGRVTSISVNSDNGLTVTGYQYADQDDANIDVSTETPLFIISADDLYAPNSGSQTPTDNTVEKLKELAKQLRDQRKQAGELTDDAITTLKATDTDIDGMNNEKALRELIKKIADYQKPKPVEYTYNFEKLTLDHEGDLTDDDYKKIVVEQFLKKNYTTTDWSKLANAYSKSATVLSGNNANTYNLTPATSGTSGLNIYTGDKQAGGVTSVGIDSSGDLVVRGWKAGSTDSHAEELIRIKKADLFTPKPKDQNPTPSADDLKKFKEQAKELINRNPKLTDKQKEEYKKQIENANTKEQIQNILKQANDQAGKNNVKPDDIKKKEKEEKEKREKEQKEKDKKEREKKQEEQTTKDKKSANDTIDGLSDLTKDEKDKLKENLNGKSGDTTKPGAKTPEEVQQIVNEAQARNAARKAIKDELPFLDHGTGAEGKTDTTHADDAALNELLGTKSGKDQTLTDLETALAKTNPAATAEEIKNALDTAKRQNAINEQNAKNAGLAKLDALLQQLTDAENGLNETQKAAIKQKVDAAKTAINGAKDTVNKATKPSDIKTAVDGVKIEDALKEINTQVTNAQQNNKQQQENENKDALANEKKEQIARINASNLSDADKKKAIDDINAATKLGDPTGIADRALKAKKIEDALKKIDEFKHLNKSQKDAFKAIINGTDAGNHKDDNGKDTGVDDIDDALANAANTDNAMARLEELKVIADKFAKGDAYKNSNDANKKKAFDDASTAAGAVLDKAKGNPKDADQVNELYKDLLKAMQDLDNTVKGAGVKTDALAAEIDSDKNLKPSETDPKTPGDPVYNTSSKDKKEAFDKALKDAEAALQTANSDNEDAKKPTSTPLTPDQEAQKQKAVDEALDKLIKARLALDGVNTKPLQDEIDKDNKVKNSDKYTYSTKDKKTAFDTALSEANELIKKLTGAADQQAQPGQGTQQPDLSTKEAKQKALDAALKKLQDAAKALDGTKPIEPTPNPNPTPTPTPSPLPTPGAGTDNPGSGNAGSGSEAGYGVNDNAPTIVDKGELNIQIDSAETDSKPGNAGAGNAGNANAGSATGAQGGAGTSSGSGMGTGTAGAANAGVDNKAVNNAVENAPEVKQADAAVKQAAATLDEALAQAKRVAADPHATQAQVDAAAVKLADARKALADAQDNAAKVRAAVRSRVIKGMRSRGNAGVAAGADVATAGLMATMIAAIGGAFVTRRMRAMHANRD